MKHSISIKRKILLVEDQIIARLPIKLILERMGYHVDVAENGADAVSCAEQTKYAVIIMDVGLPDIDGVEATKKIRSSNAPSCVDVPILGLTGHAADQKRRSACLEAGMQAVHSKPVSLGVLQSLIETWDQ